MLLTPILDVNVSSGLSGQDLADPFRSQSIDGQALQLLYSMGTASAAHASTTSSASGVGMTEALHALIREEFGSGARLGHRLRLLEGMEKIFGRTIMTSAANGAVQPRTVCSI
jgi:hypothetical protein